MTMALSSLGELRVWFVGSARLAQKLDSPCDCTFEMLDPGDWRRHMRDSESPHFLLVEGCEWMDPVWAGQVDSLLAGCKQAAIPRLLWITSNPVDPDWLVRCEDFDRVFTTEPGQLRMLDEAGANAPSPLWEATNLGMDGSSVADSEERSDPVVWLGGWSREWPEAWRRRLAAVLRGAAGLGLVIVPEADMDGLPSELQGCVEARAGEGRSRILRRAKVAIGADPVVGAHHVTSSIVFDAMACGSAVVTPHAFACYGAFSASVNGERRDFTPCVRDADSAATAIDRFLTDGALREEAVSHCRQIVAYNHTYSHRLATLASAVGLRLLPEYPQ